MPVILDIKDIMRILRIGKNTALDLMHTEGFPSFKIGGKWLIHQDKFNEWLLEQG
ncbi:TPA: helix-turn-helix domain-containing protein [Clostridium perfringens]|uniref:helix-turn-helix domain-containing protein n=1 Tax=Clostridium perfringens TaxID=1502 RepID=UPI000D787BD5|nr:helix-turn-helix domain-containing protein [Clostridium perfringens]AWS24607.1 hypothetical protein CYK96_02940 [Clostridium perfringens]EGT2191868.1 helix-turn-helix domain-containing protein [Clostridium perfringens]MDB2038794.1 helix-turn-helix domain-containing protein [Clostridium perfringens]MDB2047607.1 helix-turn-helix domain-containing protein [Clostridium perfringens]MDK0669255.1 helix-turn-helix domain-containing protein [Clostridium perfringens]